MDIGTSVNAAHARGFEQAHGFEQARVPEQDSRPNNSLMGRIIHHAPQRNNDDVIATFPAVALSRRTASPGARFRSRPKRSAVTGPQALAIVFRRSGCASLQDHRVLAHACCLNDAEADRKRAELAFRPLIYQAVAIKE
jgi:hypothetical protein